MPAGTTSACGASDYSETGIGVGWCDVGRTPRAVAWIDGQPIVLQGRLDAAARAEGWIVGTASRIGFVDSDGQPELFAMLARPTGTVAAEDGAPVRALVSVGPNPASQTATVRLGAPADATVLDVLGRTVAQQRATEALRLDVRTWAPGVYVDVAQTGDRTTRTPFTVVR